VLALIALVGLWAAVQIVQSRHGYYAHGADAERTYNCLEQNGVWKVYLEKGSKMYHFLCQDSFGIIYDLVAEKISDNLFREHSHTRRRQSKEGHGSIFSNGFYEKEQSRLRRQLAQSNSFLVRKSLGMDMVIV
jgi:hypothetical protein